jgi:hypothetical protein
VSTSTRRGAIGSGLAAAMIRRSSAQPTRRAVLHLQAPGDPAVPAVLASWFTERAFHFYAADLRLPPAAVLSARHAGRDLRPAFADLDAACTRLRRVDGMASLIVTAQGRAAAAVALWSDSRMARDDWQLAESRRAASPSMPGEAGQQPRADALILSKPAWPKGSLHLAIACPVLVIASQGASPAGTRPWPRRPRGAGAPPLHLGSHVTWLALADESADRQRFLDELGRWLGAYMYGPVRDQLL